MTRQKQEESDYSLKQFPEIQTGTKCKHFSTSKAVYYSLSIIKVFLANIN